MSGTESVVEGKPVVLVTGAGTGLGSGLVRAFAGDGFDVVVHYRSSEDGARKAAREAETLGARACRMRADLRIEAEAVRMAEEVRERFGRLDVLVNNAGVYHEIHGLELSAEQWSEGLHSTVTQTFLTTRALLPLLRSSALRRVINIGDSSCDRPGARDLAWSYHIGKTGVWILTRSLAASEAQYGIAVNMVSPGFLENSVGGLDSHEVPMGRLGTFEDVYAAVRFLALEAPAYLTGSNLMVGGGWNLR
jgi:NAD(P)-dependent dehydrogenase (short-subunit alcohol dehydrogenase family)